MLAMLGQHSLGTVLAEALAVGGWMAANQLAAMSTDELEQITARAVVAAMAKADITVKEMAYEMGVDESLLRRQLARKDPAAHLSLYRLLRAPANFWLHFSPALLRIIWQRESHRVLDDIAEAPCPK